jgi:hypothetical protein
MNTKRDKFLTEAMGECYHDFVIDHSAINPYKCKKCDFWHGIKLQNDFSTWKDFGKLWEWTQKQDWLEKFLRSSMPFMYQCSTDNLQIFTHPDKFADALYDFLNQKDT